VPPATLHGPVFKTLVVSRRLVMDKTAFGQVTCGCYRVIIAVFQCVYDVTLLTYVRQETLKSAYVSFAISVCRHVISGGQVTRFHGICLLAILLS
jgi:hypothetical protein